MLRILFYSEAMTLAHRIRPYVLSEGLSREQFEVGFAADRHYQDLFQPSPTKQYKITSLAPSQFQQALWKGQELHSYELLNLQVKEDLAIIQEFNPDLIVGDFRLSLHVSAKLVGVPLVNLTNFYWQFDPVEFWEAPESFTTHQIGVPLSNFIFKRGSSYFLRAQTKGFRAVAKKWGVKGYDGIKLNDLCALGDICLYCDIEKFVNREFITNDHQVLGPILWSPKMDFPEWWNRIPADQTSIYFNLGSSGKSTMLPKILDWLRAMNLSTPIIVGSAQDSQTIDLDPQIYVSQYLPGMEICQRSRLVICNGGSPSTQQAFAQGVPVLGLPSNVDQILNMKACLQYGAGLSIRHDQLSCRTFCESIQRLLQDQSFLERARELKQNISTTNIQQNFLNAIKNRRRS